MIELFKALEEIIKGGYHLTLNEHKEFDSTIKDYWQPIFQDDECNSDVDWREGNNIYCFRWYNNTSSSWFFISNTLDGLLDKIKQHIEEDK